MGLEGAIDDGVVSSEPSTNPLSGDVAYLAVLQPMVCSLSVTPSGAGDAACAAASNAQIAKSTAAAKPTLGHEGA